MREEKLPIPLPETAEKYGGKFVVRIPRSLHSSKKESGSGYSAVCQEGIGSKERKENGDKS